MTKLFSKLALTAAVVAAGLMSLNTVASAKELKLAHFVSPKHPMHSKFMAPMAATLAKNSAGKLTIKIYPAGALGKGPREQYNRAVDGIADITFGLHGYTSPQFPRTLLSELPGLGNSATDVTAKAWKAAKLLEGDYTDVKMLALWMNDRSVLITKDKQIKSLADLKGLKVRAPSKLAAGLLRAWGAIPQTMPVTKVYTSLQTGVIDGVFIGASAIRAFKLAEVGKFFTTGLPATFNSFYLVMNKKAWNGLSAAEKKQLNAVTGEAASMKAATGYDRAGKAGIGVAKKAGRTVEPLSSSEAAKFQAIADAYVKKVVAAREKAGIPAGKIIGMMKGTM